jgi:hypothetical protein
MTAKTIVSAAHAIRVPTTSPEAQELVTPPHVMAREREIKDERMMTVPGMSRERIISFHVADTGLACAGVW